MNCPQCNSFMFDNRETKRNPKAPDYKCSSKECGHAIWNNDKKPLKLAQPMPKAIVQALPQETKLKVLSIAKDLVVAQITALKAVDDPVTATVQAYRNLYMEILDNK